jgi:hypothetical protein
MTTQPAEGKPGRWSIAREAARKAGWGAESDDLVKLVTFVVVLGRESLPERWRHRQPPVPIIDAVRLEAHYDHTHAHVVDVRCTGGVVRSVRTVLFGLRYRGEIYVTAADTGDPVNVIASRCPLCGEDTLSTEVDESLLLALPRF